MKNALCAVNEAKGEDGDHNFADCADSERLKTLFGQFAEVGAQAHACKGQKKWRTRKIREGADLVLVEDGKRGEQRNQQETQHEFRELLPKEGCFVADSLRLAAAGPIERVGEHDKADQGVARGLGEYSEFASRVGVKSASGCGFGGVVHGEA